jgi:hypothetical protein
VHNTVFIKCVPWFSKLLCAFLVNKKTVVFFLRVSANMKEFASAQGSPNSRSAQEAPAGFGGGKKVPGYFWGSQGTLKGLRALAQAP